MPVYYLNENVTHTPSGITYPQWTVQTLRDVRGVPDLLARGVIRVIHTPPLAVIWETLNLGAFFGDEDKAATIAMLASVGFVTAADVIDCVGSELVENVGMNAENVLQLQKVLTDFVAPDNVKSCDGC